MTDEQPGRQAMIKLAPIRHLFSKTSVTIGFASSTSSAHVCTALKLIPESCFLSSDTAESEVKTILKD